VPVRSMNDLQAQLQAGSNFSPVVKRNARQSHASHLFVVSGAFEKLKEQVAAVRQGQIVPADPCR